MACVCEVCCQWCGIIQLKIQIVRSNLKSKCNNVLILQYGATVRVCTMYVILYEFPFLCSKSMDCYRTIISHYGDYNKCMNNFNIGRISVALIIWVPITRFRIWCLFGKSIALKIFVLVYDILIESNVLSRINLLVMF